MIDATGESRDNSVTPPSGVGPVQLYFDVFKPSAKEDIKLGPAIGENPNDSTSRKSSCLR